MNAPTPPTATRCQECGTRAAETICHLCKTPRAEYARATEGRKSTMKALLIDPEKQSVEGVEYDGTLEAAYRLLDCCTIDGRRLDEAGNTLFFDDEGLDRRPLRFFALIGHPYPFAGRGLIVGPEIDERQHDVTKGLRVTVEFPTPRQAVNMYNAQRREDQEAMKEMRARGVEVIDAGRSLAFDEGTGEAEAL